MPQRHEIDEDFISVGVTGYQGLFRLQMGWKNTSEQFTITRDCETLRVQQAMMTSKPGNSNWGKPDTGRQPVPNQTSFEEAVKAMKLSPLEYASSAALKEWVRKNKDHKYVPLDLLRIWGFEVRGEL